MIPTFLTAFLFFCGGVSLLASAGQLAVKNRRKENLNLSALFMCMGIILLQHAFLFRGEIKEAALIMSFHMTSLYLLGPLLFLAYFIVVHPHQEFPDRLLKYFIPAVLSLGPDIWYLALPGEEKNDIVKSFLSGPFRADVAAVKVLLAGACLQIIIYLVFLLVKIAPAWRESEKNSIMNITIIYSLSSTTAAMFLLAGIISGSLVLISVTSTATGLCIICAYILGQRYPGFLQLLQSEVKQRQYRKSRLKGIDTDTVCADLSALMEKEKLYTDEEISLKKLADRLDITLHQLSELLNEKLNMNFSTFVNRYRIEEAKVMLADEPDRSVITIAYAVGFNSKSSFYEAFSKFTGMTPYRYRKEVLRHPGTAPHTAKR